MEFGLKKRPLRGDIGIKNIAWGLVKAVFLFFFVRIIVIK